MNRTQRQLCSVKGPAKSRNSVQLVECLASKKSCIRSLAWNKTGVMAHQKFKVSLGNIATLRPAWDKCNPVSK